MGDLVGSKEELEAFNSTSDADRKLLPAVRGILVEVATSGLIRYEWPLLRPLVTWLLDQVLVEFEAESKVEVGPVMPLPGGETVAALRKRMRKAVEAFDTEAPFTLQRLAELLLEPHKQYSRLDKLALALERLLLVSSTVAHSPAPPPRPPLASLPPVNDNPAVRSPKAGAGPIVRPASQSEHQAEDNVGPQPMALNGGPDPAVGTGLASSSPATADGLADSGLGLAAVALQIDTSVKEESGGKAIKLEVDASPKDTAQASQQPAADVQQHPPDAAKPP
ncbi:hypothetical protein WJX72_010709 [[Myrmecia] bisecta]|uniref:Uncharacterized protein n=1 Tax=[Myrmecia] bisecta TaxID=41462 RepID=A0AAW1QT90_9CHLO